LKEGEFLKLGKVVFKVREIKIKENIHKIKERTQCENVPANSFNHNPNVGPTIHSNNAHDNTANNNGQTHLVASNISNNNLNMNENQNVINLIMKKNQENLKKYSLYNPV
jgi:hypothetical protein